MLHHNVASAIPTDICKSIKTKLQIHLDWEAYDEKCWTYFESVVIKPHPHLIIDLVSLVSLMPEVDQLTIPYRRNVLLPVNRLFFSFLSLKLDVTSWYFFSGSSNLDLPLWQGVLLRQRDFTITDSRSSRILAGLGVSGELRPRGGNQAVVCQLLHPQIPGSAAVYPVVPRWDALIIILHGTVSSKDQGLGGSSDA